ncbi:hypothetical protein FS749_016677 [Ceratobasidium sp. UAMH 11750]|nr:hypothetical protein FS749_016677 [Ceratobasidium sp. UAMH 11750]
MLFCLDPFVLALGYSAESTASVLFIRLGPCRLDHHLTADSTCLRMPGELDNPPPTIPRSTSRASIEITALLRPSPEPTATLSGVVPGRALFDTPDPNDQDPAELEDSQPRVPILTVKGSGWAEIRKAFHARSEQIQRTKARNALEAQESGTPLKPRKPRKPRKSRKPRKARKARKSSLSYPTGYVSDEHSTCSTMGTAVTDMSTVQSCSRDPRCKELCDCPATASTGAAGSAGTGTRSGGGDTIPGADSHNGSHLRSPSAIPGTPGQDPESGHHNLVEGIDSTGQESQHTDFVESLDPAVVVAALRPYLEYNPTAADLATFSTQDLKSVLRLYVADRTPAVASAKRKAEALKLSQKTPAILDDDDHAEMSEPEPKRSRKRSRARVVIDEDNTDTVDESEIEATETETEPNTEPPTPAYEALSSHHPSRSPSPLPSAHASIDPTTLGTLDYRFEHPAAQVPTQEPTNHFARSLSRIPTTATVFPAERPPTRPHSVRDWPSAGVDPTRSSQPSSTRPQPRDANLRLPELVSASAIPVCAPHAPVASHSHAGPSRRRDETRLPEPIPVRPPPTNVSTLHQAAELLQFLQSGGRMERIERERLRRQAVAAAAGITLTEDPNHEDPDPPLARADHLEKDLLHDDEEERSARAAEEAGESPPSARDVVGYERQILSAAKTHLFAYSLKEGAIQTHGTFTDWSGDSWIKTWCLHLPHLPPQAASTVAKQVMVNSLATGRGRFKDPIRFLVQSHFKLIKPASTPEAINHNLEIFRAVHPNAFHCQRYSPPYGHYESHLLTQAIAVTMFSNPNAIGVVHREFFEPMPLTTVAFVLAIIQFCLEEWETGRFKSRDLSMTDLLHKYVAHLRGLKETRITAKSRVERLQEKWFEFGYQYSGAIPIYEPYYQPITLRTDVRPDTPQPESEQEPETFAGRYTARAKGKGRARG